MNRFLGQCETLLQSLFQLLSGSIAMWCVLSAAGAAVLAWDARYDMNPDGIAYLDMASGTLQYGAATLVNGGWGPLYPALVAVALRLFRPSPSGEYIAVHILNWFLFVAAAMSFGFFLKQWLRPAAKDPLNLELERKRVLVPFGFVLFFWSVNELIGMGTVTPDLLVTSVVFLTAGIGCRLLQSPANSKIAAVLGLVLALGYFAKPAMFAVALIALASFLACSRFGRTARYQTFIATIAFALISAPFVALMTQHVGQLTISESATGNYLFHVSRVDLLELIRNGTLTHPPRVLIQKPVTLEFASPIPGTYPLDDDFAYWMAGAKVHFDLRRQVTALIGNLEIIPSLLLTFSAACGGVLSLLLLTVTNGNAKRPQGRDRTLTWLVMWSLCVCGTFTMVHLEGRYIAPFVVLLFLVAYRAVMGIQERVTEGAVLLSVLLAMLFQATARVTASGWNIVRDETEARRPDNLIIADAIRNAGVNTGAYVAVVGSGFSAVDYARLAGVRIVVEIRDEDAFWNLSPSESIRVSNRLADLHVRALVSADSTLRLGDSGWSEVKGLRSSHFQIKPLVETCAENGR